jgi:hypothetical protein
MKGTNTQSVTLFDLRAIYILLLSLFFTTPLFSQTVTNVFPTRVTTGSTITIVGTGFTPALVTNTGPTKINFPSDGMGITKRTFINSELMTFEIGRTDRKTTNTFKPLAFTSADISRELAVNGTLTGFTIHYIAPTQRVHRINGNGNITRVEEIYSDYDHVNGFWRSNLGSTTADVNNQNAANEPDNNHDLLGFKYDGTIYSTGVNDALLTARLPANETDNLPTNSKPEYVSQVFKAYATNGIQSLTENTHHIFTGDLVDNINGEGTGVANKPAVRGLTMNEVLIDGVNGLNLGTGVNNLNSNTTVRFFSGNGQAGTVAGDNIPDLLITNMAEAGRTDVYSYQDIDGNIIGRPLSVEINNSDVNNPALSEWDQDQYRVTPGVSFDVAVPTRRIYGQHQKRPMRVIAFKLSEFGINDNTMANDPIWSIESVNNINVGAGGSADFAFLAYNRAAFAIKSPTIVSRPISRSICRLTSTIDVTFNVEAGIDGRPTGNPKEVLSYQWYKFNSEISGETGENLLVPNVTGAELGLYRLKVSNGYGSTIVPVSIEEGGTPSFWNNTTNRWDLPTGFISEIDAAANLTEAVGKIIIPNKDRRLIYTDNYSQNVDIEGCDCVVPAGSVVTIPSGKTLTLYGNITVEPEVTIVDLGGGPDTTIPAGLITIENNASLVQTQSVTTNKNSGAIHMERMVSAPNASDYVYWSSPVADFNIDNISNTPRFLWNVEASNPGSGEGNWESAANAIMTPAQGYIVRVPSASTFTTNFIGIPNNGEIDIRVKKGSNSTPLADRGWNLLGNPYPSALNVKKFLKKNSKGNRPNIEGAVHLWTRATPISSIDNPDDSPFYQDFQYNYNANDYISCNASGQVPANPSNPFRGNIAAGQGFFVKAERDNKDIVFNNDMRFDATDYDNDQFYRQGSQNTIDTLEDQSQKVWLTLVNEDDIAVSTLVSYIEGATLEKDNMFDARTNGGVFSIYSMIAEDKLVIQGRPVPFINSDTVPIGVILDQDGIFNIAIDHIEGSLFVAQEQAIYLEDTYLNMIHDLRQSPYTFSDSAGNISDRFVLRYTNNVLSVNDIQASKTYAFVNDNILKVRSSQNIKEITMYDLTGKTIARHRIDGSQTIFSASFNFAKGVYLANITLENGALVTKKLIN